MHTTSTAHDRQADYHWPTVHRGIIKKIAERETIIYSLNRLAPGAAVSNKELAALLGCSAGQASKLVDRHPKLLRRQKCGRSVAITRT